MNDKNFHKKRFGNIAIEKGYITADDLIKALTDQVYDDVENEELRQVGSILLEEGIMTASQVEDVVRTIMKYNEEK